MAKLNLKYATMNSGKSIDLMRTAYNYEENGYRVLIAKPACDTKGGDYLDSRIGLRRKVDILIDDDTNIIKEVKNRYTKELKCVLVDEAEFLSPTIIDDLFILSKVIDIPVICYSLRTNFKMEGFPGSVRLLEIAENIEELKTLCKCGKTARFAGRKVNGKFTLEGDSILIDGSCNNVEYVPLCGDCYLKKVKKIDYKNY